MSTTAPPALRFTRRYSLFAPDYTYAVLDPAQHDRWIGEVARNKSSRRWHSSNLTWTSGADLPGTSPTRHEAALRLLSIQSQSQPQASV